MPSMNILAVIVVAVVSMVTGSIWYSKMGFQEMWVKLSGVKMAEGSNANMVYAATAVAALVRAFVLSWFVVMLNTTGLTNGLGLGLVVWLGFVLPPFFATYMFGGKSKKLLAIDAGYYLVDLLIGGAILALWR